MIEWVPPVLQPPKPRKFEELLDVCVMAALTHDKPRTVVAKVFADNELALAIQRKATP